MANIIILDWKRACFDKNQRHQAENSINRFIINHSYTFFVDELTHVIVSNINRNDKEYGLLLHILNVLEIPYRGIEGVDLEFSFNSSWSEILKGNYPVGNFNIVKFTNKQTNKQKRS